MNNTTNSTVSHEETISIFLKVLNLLALASNETSMEKKERILQQINDLLEN